MSEICPTAPPEPLVLCLSDLLGDWDREAAALHLAKMSGKARGPVTGMGRLDRELSGFLAPGLHILHGAPGTGKTALCLQMAANCGCPCLLVSCEMAPMELLRRIVARTTGTRLGNLKNGELQPNDASRLVREALRKVPYIGILDATQTYPTAAAILNAAETTRRLDAGSPHLLVVVDSVHSWAEGALEGTEYERLNEHLSALRKLSARLDCPVLAVAERNRSSMNAGGMSAGAGTRKLEYTAESVMDMQLPEKSSGDVNGQKPVDLTLQKNRNGSPGRAVSLLFNGAFQSFTEAS